MTTIQQVLFELETDYMGHPYYLTGHALYTALARRVDAQARRSLNVSTGVFVPGEYGAYPESHSHDGYGGKLGMSLPPVESYEDVFVCRDAAQRWLLDSRPRDAHNTHDVQSHGGRLAFAPKLAHFGRPPSIGTASGRCTGTSTATCTPMGRRGRPPAFRGCTGWAACRRGSKLRVR